jgi:HlyD family secretion protein
MNDASVSIFRTGAVERLSSPEQLDQLVKITRPFDWMAVAAIAIALAVLMAWSIIGRIPTRVSGEGILVSNGGRVIDAVSAVTARLASIDVMVGDRVTRGQVLARASQTDAEQRYRDVAEVLRERERERSELIAAIDLEIATKSANYAAQEAGLDQVIAVAEQRAAYLVDEVARLEGAVSTGFVLRRTVEERRRELNDAQQRITDSRNDILRLKAQKLDLETQRARDRLESTFRVNEARRQMEQLAGAIERESKVISPVDGRVIEIKVSAGAVLAVGTPVIEIETEGAHLTGIIYIPADHGKSVKPGMQVRVEPATVKPEEFGALIGRVATISDFPVTPQGMSAVLHNEALVSRFSRGGAPYAAVVELERDERAESGYRWSSGRGPPLRLSAGTLTRADITTREQPPISLVVPLMKRSSGIGQ